MMTKRRWGMLLTVLLAGALVIGSCFTSFAKKSDDDDDVEKERLEEVSDLWWDDNGEANWGEIEGKYQYEVSLYRDGSRVTTVKTKNEKYKFYSKMTKDGEYSFRVRALAKSSDREYENGPWSEMSETYDVDEDYAKRVRDGSSGNTGNNKDDDEDYDGKPKANHGWQQNQTGWWWLEIDGSYPAGTWKTIGGSDYYFDANGYMMTGWHTIDGKNCFFDGSGKYHPEGETAAAGSWQQDQTGWWWREADGTSPANTWKMIGEKWYFFDSTGYMKKGWVSWNNVWYYCDDSGAMIANGYTPDGYWADGSGVTNRR